MGSASSLVLELLAPAVLNPASIAAFSAQLAELDRERTRFLVLRGGERVFCNGLDLQWIAAEDLRGCADLDRFADLLTQLQTGPFITVAVVEGPAVGGGLGLLAACDFVLATPAAEFALTEGMLGFVPGIILPFLLDKLAPSTVKRLVFTGRRYGADELMAWGLVDEVVDPAFLEHRLSEFLQAMKSCKPQAIGTLKGLLAQAQGDRQGLIRAGVASLLEHLARPAVKTRLATIAAYLST